MLAGAGIRHAFSTRRGGESRAYLHGGLREPAGPPDGELNLGFTASDPVETVLGNRAKLLRETFGRLLPLVTLQQVHSTSIYRVALADAREQATLPGDGLLTGESGVALGVQTADCVPVLLADPATGAVGAFHAGWRGTLGRIVERGVARMVEEFGAAPQTMLAAIGPAIGPCCYGVGEEVEQQFRDAFPYADAIVRPPARRLAEGAHAEGALLQPRSHLDLPESNRRQLLAAGLPAAAVEVLPFCTFCRKDLFFSYRAEQGHTGRMLAVIARS